MTLTPRRKRRILCVTSGVLAIGTWIAAPSLLPRLGAQSPQDHVSYTTAQAERGRTVYAEHCASCHGPHLDDGAFGPSLMGVGFRLKWGSTSTAELFTYTSSRMPPAVPGSLGDQRYADLVALMLEANGSPAGAQALSVDDAALKTMGAPGWMRPLGGGLAKDLVLPPPPPRANPLDAMQPVTERMLVNPPEGDWLTWRRTYNAYGFSPLRKINRTNVSELRPAWSWGLRSGPNQSAPLVHDGVMFVYSYGDRVQALDAATGDLLWQYSRRLPQGVAPSVKRGMSIYGTRIYMPTSDAHVVALDAKTGKVVWDQAIADPKDGYDITGGTLVARGKVMVGTRSIRALGGNYIVALDTETGKEAWRFGTIARPGDPADRTWNELPAEKRSGGSVWHPGSYDPVHNLAFFGSGNTYDTAPLRTRINKPGVTNDGLYLNSTIALNPDTGRLVWYFQHQANDQWDLDWAFERLLVDLPVNGDLRSVVVTSGKQMIFDVIETETGKYVASADVGGEAGMQNVVTAIDPKTGAKIVDANLVPGDGRVKMVCPHVDGGRDWMPSSYDMATRMLYVPWVEACMDMNPVVPGERGYLTTGVHWSIRPPPNNKDGRYGRVQAINLETRKTVWLERQRAPVTSGVLATAGGLVFAGSLDRMFSAFDAKTGEKLWSMRLNDVPAAVPISYSVRGQEYIATIVGPGGAQSMAYGVLVPEFQNPPERATTLWVFEVKR